MSAFDPKADIAIRPRRPTVTYAVARRTNTQYEAVQPMA